MALYFVFDFLNNLFIRFMKEMNIDAKKAKIIVIKTITAPIATPGPPYAYAGAEKNKAKKKSGNKFFNLEGK